MLLVESIHGQQYAVHARFAEGFCHFFNFIFIFGKESVCNKLSFWNTAITNGGMNFTNCISEQEWFATKCHNGINFKSLCKPLNCGNSRISVYATSAIWKLTP
jgi:hypothetical protein